MYIKSLRYIAIAVGVAAMSVSVAAQTSYDAENLFGEDLNGTARYVGMGGAMAAFGSDLSVISKNPAGIGTYLNSDFNLTFSGSSTSTQMTGAGSAGFTTWFAETGRSDFKFGIDNASFVLALPTYASGSLKNMNVAFAYRRVRDIDRTIFYDDDFDDGTNPVEFRSIQDNQRYIMNAYDFNLSFNHADRVFWGVNIESLTAMNNSNGYFYHYFPKQSGMDRTDINSVDRATDLSGHGWNFSLGMIVRPAEGPLRIGASVKSPTYFRLDEIYMDYLYAHAGEVIPDEDVEKYTDDIVFNLTSPWVFNASLGYVVGRCAFGLEYEYNAVDRTSMRISGVKLPNQCGNRDYKSYSVLRAGFEANISKFSVRWGYNYSFPRFNSTSHEYLQDTEFNKSRCDWEFENKGDAHTVTLGAGYCGAPGEGGGQFYADMAYAYSFRNSEFCPGEFSDDPLVPYRTGLGRLVLTLGVTF